jgi:hypothetical protein
VRRKVVPLAAGVALITLLSGVALAGSAAVGSECDFVTGNLVANCGFETDTASWTIAGTPYVDTDASVARTGSSGLLAYPRVALNEWVSLSQDLATTPGQAYEVRFYLYPGGSIVSPSLRVEVSGGTAPAGLEVASGTYFGYWQPLTFEFTAAGSVATLTFTFFGRWDMDDVAVYAPLAPTVTGQPASATAVAETMHQFSAEASGAYVPTVQWQESSDAGATWSDITGATSRTLSVTAAMPQRPSTGRCSRTATAPARTRDADRGAAGRDRAVGRVRHRQYHRRLHPHGRTRAHALPVPDP